ncbi:MAG TPA: hypothetical protein VFV08_06575, partial [Puia sp.]|nr:hypothetical protein [Puia sp.]
ASYSPRLPENIRDSILSVFNTLDEKTKQAWEIVSVLPTGFESKNLEIMEPTYPLALKTCFNLRILIERDGLVFFKHELYRRTIESTLSPLTRIQINKKVLELFLGKFEQAHQLERIIHHAKNANEHELVVKYAPLAARQAALVGAHTEASRLYLSAIEYYQGNDPELLIELYQAYSYECYLTGHMKEAIINGAKSLELLKEKGEKHRLADGMRYLSRFWWFDGNRKKAEYYAQESIDLFEELPDSPEKAMAFSNMSQLKMLSFETTDCIYWGRKAIDMAKKLHNEEILSHALTNVGAIQASISNTHEKGMELLQQSLDLAMKVNCQEHAGRTFTNLTCGAVEMRDYHAAKKYIDEGLSFCEERGLDSWGNFILTYKAKMLLDLGRWDEAYAIADRLVKLEGLTAVVRIGSLIVLATIKMRRGDGDPLPLLHEAKELAFDTMEMQRIIPLTIAFLEYECITGNEYLDQKDLQVCLSMIDKVGNNHKKS